MPKIKKVKEPDVKRKSKRVEESEPTPKRSTEKVKKGKAEHEFDPYSDIDNELDQIEKKYGISSSILDRNEQRISTGLLNVDLVLGGGLCAGGWYTAYGPEQSCKSTLTMTILASLLRYQVRIASIHDYEGSSDPEYIENIMGAIGVLGDATTLFGQKNEETGEWIVKPRVRYYSPNIGEKFFDYLAKLERTLPDKIKIGDNYYLIYENTKENQKKYSGHYDVKYLTRNGKLKVLANDGLPQAVILVDSYPAMNPRSSNVDDPSSALSLQARMFSEGLRRVKGGMRDKRILVFGVNQLREKPMVMFGPSEYEPGGNALKFFSDVRFRLFPRVPPKDMEPKDKKDKEGMVVREKSVQHEGAKDSYRYIHLKAHKNKLSVPYLDTMLRLWISDAEGTARGFDPCWDVYQYLIKTGQLSGSTKKGIVLKTGTALDKLGKLSWDEFKLLVVGSTQQIRDFCRNNEVKPMRIKEWCFKQMESGKGFKMFLEERKNSLQAKALTQSVDIQDDDDD